MTQLSVSLNPPFPLDESKFHEPRARPGIVDRAELVERLHASAPRPVLAVTAPAGYGKSTFLAQYVQRRQPRVAWLSLDSRDNDPAVLLTYLAAAVDRVEPISHFEPKVLRSLASPGSGIAAVVQLASSISAMSEPISIVLDHAEALSSRECRDMVAEFALRIPEGSELAIGSRQQVPLPVSRLRADRSMIEVGVEQLAMGDVEAQLLLSGAGVQLDDADRQALVSRTEGWPAGLYLAALAIGPGSRRAHISESFSGDDRFMGDYLRSEFLRRVSRADATFLTRTSILDRMNGSLCDATVGGSGSARVLDRLERRNLLVIPLDRRADWYRYHHLFRDLLHAELLRREPETVKDLHLRAAAWFEANGMAEAAVDHAQQAGDVELVARLVLELANPVWAEGRLDTVLSWMEWFSVDDRLDDHPAVAAHGALDLRAHRQSGRRRALGRCGRSGGHRWDADRRQHDGELAGVPARDCCAAMAWIRYASMPKWRWRGSHRPVLIGRPCCTPRA